MTPIWMQNIPLKRNKKRKNKKEKNTTNQKTPHHLLVYSTNFINTFFFFLNLNKEEDLNVLL